MIRRRWTIVVTCLIFLCAAGCGADSDVEQANGLLETRLEARSPHSFLDLITAEVDANIDVTLCMKQQGFEYEPYSYNRERERLSTMVEVYDDAESFAATYGYGITSPDMAEPAEDYVLAPIDTDHETALYGRPVSEMAADGDPPAGCWGESMGTTIELVEVFQPARKDLSALVDADEAVERARSAWELCMASEGFNYYSPEQALDHFAEASGQIMMSAAPGSPLLRSDFEALLEEEITTAVADQIACDGADLRSLRVEVAQRIGLSPEAATALEGLAK